MDASSKLRCISNLKRHLKGRSINLGVFFIAFMGVAIPRDWSILDAKRLAWSVGDEECLVNTRIRQRLLFIAAIDWR